MNIEQEYERWLANATEDPDIVRELKTLNDDEIEDARPHHSGKHGPTPLCKSRMPGAGFPLPACVFSIPA